jgi:ribonuclease VapC
MVIDTSAILAIALNEPEATEFEERIADDPIRLISAATALEAAIVLEKRLGDAGGREFDLWPHKIGAELVPVDAEQTDAARRAWRRYGKGGACHRARIRATRWLIRTTMLFSAAPAAKQPVGQSFA